MNRLNKFNDALRTLPASGGGGCHAALLGRANLGLAAGLTPEQVFQHLRNAVHGPRRVPDAEIMAAIRRAAQDAPAYTGPRPRWTPRPTPTPPTFDGEAARRRFIERGAGVTEADLRDVSPVRIDWSPDEDGARLLAALYTPEDVLFIGDNAGCHAGGRAHVRTVAEWMERADKVTRWPHIIPNPLTGQAGPTKADPAKLTLRGDACVQAFRFAVMEFDELPRAEQLAFFAGTDLPLAVLIDSGGKSIHGWLRVEMPNESAWDENVRPLFRDRLAPMGVDRACANPSRLSRLPGHHRADTGRQQRILFLDPSARGPRHALNGGNL